MNEEAQISAATARQQNCLQGTFTACPHILIAAGGDEPEGWIGQSESFAAMCIAAQLRTQMLIVADSNHFTILEQATNPAEPVCSALFELWCQRAEPAESMQ